MSCQFISCRLFRVEPPNLCPRTFDLLLKRTVYGRLVLHSLNPEAIPQTESQAINRLRILSARKSNQEPRGPLAVAKLYHKLRLHVLFSQFLESLTEVTAQKCFIARIAQAWWSKGWFPEMRSLDPLEATSYRRVFVDNLCFFGGPYNDRLTHARGYYLVNMAVAPFFAWFWDLAWKTCRNTWYRLGGHSRCTYHVPIGFACKEHPEISQNVLTRNVLMRLQNILCLVAAGRDSDLSPINVH